MANLNRKERRAQRNESNTIGITINAYSLGSALSALAVVSIWSSLISTMYSPSLQQTSSYP